MSESTHKVTVAPRRTYRLQDLIDIPLFQAMQDRLNEIYPFPSAIVDNQGHILTATAWQDVCTIFHRRNPICEKDCITSDQQINHHLSEAGRAISYRCPRGLVDSAAPIMIDGVHYGNFFTGQLFLDEPDLDFFRKQAAMFGFDEDSYIEAVQKVPIWTKQKLDSYLAFIHGLINVITTSGLKKLQEMEIREKVEANEERASAILDRMLDGFWVIDGIDGRITDVNQAMCNLLGYTRAELLTMTVAEIETNSRPAEIKEQMLKVIEDGSAQFERQFRRKDGVFIDVEASVTYLKSTGIFFGFHRDITERKRLDAGLRASEARFRSIFMVSTDGIFINNATEGKFAEVNEALAAILGYERHELIGQSPLEMGIFVDPSQREKMLAAVEKNGAIHDWELQIRKKDGEIRLCTISASALNLEGRYYSLGVVRDITARRQAENERESLLADIISARDGTARANATLNALLERVSDGFVAFDANFNYTYVNAHGGEMLGRTPQDLVGKNYWTEYPEARDTPFARAYVRAFETQQPIFFEDYYVHWDRWFINRIYPSPEGITIFFSDITERKRAEAAMQESRDQLQAIVQTASDAIITVNQDQKISFWNQAAANMFGYQISEITNQPLTLLLPYQFIEIDENGDEKIFSSLLTARGVTIELTARHKNSREFPVEISFAGWETRKGHFVSAILRDITERKQHERELEAIATLSAALRQAPSSQAIKPVLIDQLVSILNIDAALIELIDPLNHDSVVENAYGPWTEMVGLRQTPGSGLNGIINRTQKPYTCPDLRQERNLVHSEWAQQDIRGVAGVQLVAQEILIGYLWIGRKSAITKTDVQLLTTIGEIGANAIHRAALHDQALRSANELVLAYDTTLIGWARALELRDQETEGHSQRVVGLTLRLADRFGIPKADQTHIRYGAILHDIGKMGVPDSILHKSGPLTEEEWQIMRRHPDSARQMLEPIQHLQAAIDIPYCHHEKWDGSGYPRGLIGTKIPLPARMFAIVDVWDALRSDRPYRPAWSDQQAREYIQAQAGIQFDPQVVRLFLEIISSGEE